MSRMWQSMIESVWMRVSLGARSRGMYTKMRAWMRVKSLATIISFDTQQWLFATKIIKIVSLAYFSLSTCRYDFDFLFIVIVLNQPTPLISSLIWQSIVHCANSYAYLASSFLSSSLPNQTRPLSSSFDQSTQARKNLVQFLYRYCLEVEANRYEYVTTCGFLSAGGSSLLLVGLEKVYPRNSSVSLTQAGESPWKATRATWLRIL